MKLCWKRVGLWFNSTGVLVKTQRTREGHVRVEAEMKAIGQPGQRLTGGVAILLPSPWALKNCESNFPLFKPARLCCFPRLPLERAPSSLLLEEPVPISRRSG